MILDCFQANKKRLQGAYVSCGENLGEATRKADADASSRASPGQFLLFQCSALSPKYQRQNRQYCAHHGNRGHAGYDGEDQGQSDHDPRDQTCFHCGTFPECRTLRMLLVELVAEKDQEHQADETEKEDRLLGAMRH